MTTCTDIFGDNLCDGIISISIVLALFLYMVWFFGFFGYILYIENCFVEPENEAQETMEMNGRPQTDRKY